MFAIIYWIGENEVYPLLTPDLQLRFFEKVEEADRVASEFESINSRYEIATRVISIEGVVS